MQLVRGVIPRPCAKPHSIDDQIQDIIQRALEEKLIEVGERVVITAGLPLHTPGTTNTQKVLQIDESYLKK